MEIQPICPACGATLKKVPQRKTKCPACGGFMFVKYSPSNRQKRLVTEAEAERIEREWGAHYQKEHVLSRYGITAPHHAKLRKQMVLQFGEADADWNVEYFLLRESFAKAAGHEERSFSAFQIAILMNKRGMDYKPYLLVHFHEKLLGFQARSGSGFIEGVEIQKSKLPNVCPICCAGDGQKLPLAEAIKKMVLPHRGCSCVKFGEQPGYCGCDYRMLFRGELKGKVLRLGIF